MKCREVDNIQDSQVVKIKGTDHVQINMILLVPTMTRGHLTDVAEYTRFTV